jgi:uncharacterized protein (DUF1501 family)
MSRSFRFCDGVPRRSVLRAGFAGLLGAPLGLEALLARRAAAAESSAAPAGESQSSRSRDDVSLVIVFLKGGLSTIDTLDMKPEAPPEFRGEFEPGDTVVPGLRIATLLPRTARQADKFALLRSMTHPNSNHGQADHYMLTGYHPTPAFNPNLSPNNERPSCGSIIARSLGTRGSVPPYVCLPQMHDSAGPAYLGPGAAPFVVEADPNAPDFQVPDLVPPLVVDAARFDRRRELLATVDRFRRSGQTQASSAARQMSGFREKAFELMASAETRAAFDIAREHDRLRDEYGRHTLGQSCLMARRLVESGVRCVTIEHSNWDTHDNNFRVLKDDLLPQFDTAISTLFRDLHDRGRLESTLVMVFGEFGRTPRINPNAGRDHWGPSNTILLGGGGIVGGRVVGATNARAEKPASDPCGPEDLAATAFHLLGIDPEREFLTPEGRPVKIVNNGRVLRDLL